MSDDELVREMRKAWSSTHGLRAWHLALAVVRAHDAAAAAPADAPGGVAKKRLPGVPCCAACIAPGWAMYGAGRPPEFPCVRCGKPTGQRECMPNGGPPAPADAPVAAPVPVVTPGMCEACEQPEGYCAENCPVRPREAPPVTPAPAVVPATVECDEMTPGGMCYEPGDFVCSAKTCACNTGPQESCECVPGGGPRCRNCGNDMVPNRVEPAPTSPVVAPPPAVTAKEAMDEARRLVGEPFSRLRRAFSEAWAMLRRDKCGTDFEDALRDVFTVVYDFAAGQATHDASAGVLLERAARLLMAGDAALDIEVDTWLADHARALAAAVPGGAK